jgi:hypothetical protein
MFNLFKYKPNPIVNKPTEEFGIPDVKLESDRSTVSTDRTSVSSDYIQVPNTADPFEGFNYVASDVNIDDFVKPTTEEMKKLSPEEIQKLVDARKAELEASRQKQITLKQQKEQVSQKESDILSSKSKASFQRIDKIDRILAFFSPAYTVLKAVPIVGEILETAGEFIVKFKEDRKLIAIGDLIFKNTDQMFSKIAEMEKLYSPSTKVTTSTTQQGGKSTPKEFIELIELLEELYITLLSMVLTEQRVNLIAKQLIAKGQYEYDNNPECGKASLNFSGLGCTFNEKLLAYIDSRQTIQPRIGYNKNANTNATSWVFRKLKTAGKSIYRYGIAGEMIVQLQQLNTFVNTSFNIALAQYVLDVKDELETTIQQIKASADEAVKTAEAAINIVSIRQTISSVQTDLINRDSSAPAAQAPSAVSSTGGKRITKKRGEKKQKKQKFGKTRRTRA